MVDMKTPLLQIGMHSKFNKFALMAICANAHFSALGNAASKDTLNNTEVKFVKHAASAIKAEAKIAELGVKKAESADVKALAETIQSGHTKAHEEVLKLATIKGVDLSGVIEPAQAETYQELEKASGAEFDRQYIAEIVESHETSIGLFKDSLEDSKDTDLTAWVIQMIPTLQSHLTRAKQLNAKSTTSSSTTSEPTNSAVNARDRDDKKLTPLDQGSSKSDVEITAQIRKKIIATENMSVNAQNVKIITTNGQVTLRGPVNSAAEKKLIGEIAEGVVHAKRVDNQLDVKGSSSSH